MHKCPICHGPVTSRIFQEGRVAYVDGAQIYLTRIESEFLKLVRYHPMISLDDLGRLLDIGPSMTRHCAAEVRRKLRGTAARLKKRHRGGYYLQWQP